MNTSEKITVVIVAILVIILIVYFGFIKGGDSYVYYLTKGQDTENTLIEDYKSFQKLIKDKGVNETIINQKDFSKSDILEIFNEEYFNSKKVAIVVTYEDTSKSYIYSIDKVKYNSDKTSATIYYTDKAGEYAGTLKNSWYNYMIVELEGSVTSVDFQKTVDEKK